MSDGVPSGDIRELQADLQRLLDARLTERTRVAPESRPDAEDQPAAPPPKPAAPPPQPSAPPPQPSAPPPKPAAPSPKPAAPPPKPAAPRRPEAAPERYAGDAAIHSGIEADASHNPAGPRSSIGRKRSTAAPRPERVKDRGRELEQEVLRLRIRAETAEEALADAERFYEERVRQLQARIEELEGGHALQKRGDKAGPKDDDETEQKGRLLRLFGR